MIIVLLLNLLVMIIGVIFSWLPEVTTLPTIFGFDVDALLVTGVGYMRTVFQTFWVLDIMFQGFLVIMLYYVIKITIRFFLGHRTPGN